jgi:hypothetical protein
MRLLRAGHLIARRLNCGVMWPDPKEGRWFEFDGFACTEDSSFTRRVPPPKRSFCWPAASAAAFVPISTPPASEHWVEASFTAA